jgi:hypothetical protein
MAESSGIEGLGLAGAIFLGLGLAPTAYKVFALDYAFFELWRQLLLDLSVVAVFALLLGTKGFLDRPLVYGSLFLLFLAAYLNAHRPEGWGDWFGTGVVFAFLWAVVFPRLHAVAGYYAAGLLLAYVLVVRIYLPTLNRDEAGRLLAAPPEVVAREFYKATGNFKRPMVAAETLRYFMVRGEGYRARLEKAVALTARVREQLEEQGISHLELQAARVRTEPVGEGRVRVALPAQEVPCVLRASDAEGLRLKGTARVTGMAAELAVVGGQPRVSAFEDGVRVELVPGR